MCEKEEIGHLANSPRKNGGGNKIRTYAITLTIQPG
jgi:hypothetical protein